MSMARVHRMLGILVATVLVSFAGIEPALAVTTCNGKPVDPGIPNSGGTTGPDNIVGNGFANVLGGDAGDDDITGNGGADDLCGNPDQDSITAGAGND
jgi:hypothetical protein